MEGEGMEEKGEEIAKEMKEEEEKKEERHAEQDEQVVVPTVKVKMPTTPVPQPNEGMRVKLKVSGTAKKQLDTGKACVHLTLRNGNTQTLMCDENLPLAPQLKVSTLREMGVDDEEALHFSIILHRLTPDWVWDTHVQVLDWNRLGEPEALFHTTATIDDDGEATIVAHPRVGDASALEKPCVNVRTGLPRAGACHAWLALNLTEDAWAHVGCLVRLDDSTAVVTSVDAGGITGVVQLLASGTERPVKFETCVPWRPRHGEAALVIKGASMGKAGRATGTQANIFAVLELDDESGSILIPWHWLCKRGDVRPQEQVERMAEMQKALREQREALIRQIVPPLPPLPTPKKRGRPPSSKKTPAKEAVPAPPVVEAPPVAVVAPEEQVSKAVLPEPKKKKKQKIHLSVVDATASPAAIAKHEGKQVVAAAANVSVLRFVGIPDDTPVPLRGTPPSWLFENWQGAMLVKVHGFPLWPCRVGSTLDLYEYPQASEVPDSQKDVFLYFFGDKTVSWARYEWLSPWPRENTSGKLAAIAVPKKHQKTWNAAVVEATEWDEIIQSQPLAPPPIEKDAETALMQPVVGSRKKAIKREEPEESVPLTQPDASASSRPPRLAATPEARQRHLLRGVDAEELEEKRVVKKKKEDGAEAPGSQGWVELVKCQKCHEAGDEDLLLLCDSQFCSAALHTYCNDPPLDSVPEEEWLCPQHAIVATIYCPVCSGGENEDLILLCDYEGCIQGYHMYCLEPPLDAVPEREWFCPIHDGSGGASARTTPGVAPVRDLTKISSSESVQAKNRARVAGDRSRGRRKKNKDAPKNPRGAYLFWAATQREAVRKENPQLSFAEVSKLLGQRWATFDDDTKRPWQELAAQDRQRYANEMTEYNARQADDFVPANKRHRRKTRPVKLTVIPPTAEGDEVHNAPQLEPFPATHGDEK